MNDWENQEVPSILPLQEEQEMLKNAIYSDLDFLDFFLGSSLESFSFLDFLDLLTHNTFFSFFSFESSTISSAFLFFDSVVSTASELALYAGALYQ
jgi:hypothetical protein